MNCPICSSKEVTLFTQIENYPAIIWPVNQEESNRIPCKTIVVFLCSACGHIFQDENDLDFVKYIYENLYQYYTHENVEAMNMIYRGSFEEIFSKLTLPIHAEVLEIGTRSAEQMKIFVDKDMKCTAINPGAKTHEKIHFIDGYYGEIEIEAKFDLIVARLLLEHIHNVSELVSKMQANLKENGFIIIQVPNTLDMMKDKVLNFLVHEHFHYFNHNSLVALFENLEFELVFINNVNSASIIAVFKRKSTIEKEFKMNETKLDIMTTINDYREVTKVIKEEISQLATTKKIIFYGAGLSLTGIIYDEYENKEILKNCQIIDDNTLYRGKTLPLTNNLIVNAYGVSFSQHHVIVITCRSIYQEKIVNKIKELKWNIPVYAIGPKGISKLDEVE